MTISALIRIHPAGHRLDGKCYSSIGIDTQAAPPAPVRERLRINIDFLDNSPAAFVEAEACLRLFQPLVVGGGHDLGVVENG